MLSWNVYCEDPNAKQIVIRDIFKGGYYERKAKEYKALCHTKEEFAEAFRPCLMGQFWSRCEYEIVLTSWPPYLSAKELEELHKEAEHFERTHGCLPYRLAASLDIAKKIDIFDQIELNWEQFIDYVWNNTKEEEE